MEGERDKISSVRFQEAQADIALQKTAVSILLEAEKLNERIIEMKLDQEDFLHAVSHDLRGPVNNIEGISELLKESLEKEDIQEIKTLMGYMQHSVKSMGALILELTEERKAILRNQATVQEVNLEEIHEEVIMLLADHPTYPKAQINTDFLAKSIIYNKKDLVTILYSLYYNAFQHFNQILTGLTLEVSSRKNGEVCEILVRDNGPGISRQIVEGIAAKNISVEFGKKTPGLSLKIISKLLESKQGRMAISSNENQGTIINLYISQNKK